MSQANKTTPEAILPLSGLQMPFWVYDTVNRARNQPGGTVQVQFRLTDVYDIAGLQRAWTAVHRAHPMMRASVNTTKTHDTLLVVRRACDAPFNHADWTGLPADEQRQRIDAHLQRDRQTPLDLAKAPASRFFCASLDESTVWCLWTCHHVLLDGWSSALIIGELITQCANDAADTPGAPPPGADYVAYRRFIDRQPAEPARRYWSDRLRGLTQPTLVAQPSPSGVEATPGTFTAHRTLSSELTEKLTSTFKSKGITLASVLEGAWALTCASATRRTDVVFGVVTTGRSSDFEGLERIAGMFTNVLPLRTRTDTDAPLTAWLSALQAGLFEATLHEHLPLADIIRQGEPALHTVAFDSVLAIETLPAIQPDGVAQPCIQDYRSGTVNGFPLGVTVIPGETLCVTLAGDRTRMDNATVSALADRFLDCLRACLDNPDAHLGDVVARVAAPEQPAAAGTASPRSETILRGIVEPKSERDMEVLSLFEEELNRYPLSMDSDLFANGGTSLNLLRLIETCKARFGKQVGLARFLETPTVAGLSEQLADDAHTGAIPSLVTLRAAASVDPADSNGQSRPSRNVFCLHAGGGHALFYRPLAKRLHADYTVYALQPKGIDGTELPSDNVADMVSDYLEDILRVQQDGPFHFLSYCFGSALMIELVHQLKARELDVGHLIIADAIAPIIHGHPAARWGWNAYLAYEFVAQGQFSGLRHGVVSQLKRLTRNTVRDRSEEDVGHTAQVHNACETAFRNYRARPFDGHLNILMSRTFETANAEITPFMRGWEKLSTTQSVQSVDVTHQDFMREPHVSQVADVVNRILGGTQPEA
ncbi:MAG: alpha/beta fold hydrolase [Pseudomonadota bacterium]